MKVFIAFAALIAASNAALSGFSYYTLANGLPLVRLYPSSNVYSAHSSSLATPTQEQYQWQDGMGQYGYGYSGPQSAKEEVRSVDGITRGAYSYQDQAGKLQSVQYTADDNGFHVVGTNLPKPVAAPTFRAQEAAVIPNTIAVSEKLPQPVQETPSVAAARADHLKRFEQEKLRNAIIGSTNPIPAVYSYGVPNVVAGYYY